MTAVLTRWSLLLDFVLAFCGVVLLNLIFDGHVRIPVAIAVAIGVTIGMASTRLFPRARIRS